MDSYDPNFNPNDPDMGYVDDGQLPPEYDPDAPEMPGVDAGVYDEPPLPGYDDDLPGYDDQDQIVYGDDDPNYGAYPGPDGDVPQSIGGDDVYADENGNYGDGFDDDDDVYLDNHRANQGDIRATANDVKTGDYFWRNCVGSCMCCLIGCGLVLLVFRIGAISEADAKKNTVYVHGKVGLIPPPPELATKCSHERVLSEKGFYECELLCEAADCCNYPTTLALSCLAGNDDECLEYHQHCSVLELDNAALVNPPATTQLNMPEAPKDIANKCNIESLRTVPGFEGCVNDCMQAECCWKKDGSVHPCTSLEVCSGYASCLTMDVTDHVNININQEIEEKCADDKILSEVGRNQCVFACSHAACCFDPGATCPHDDARFCSQYQPCQKIFDDNGQVIQGGSTAASNIPVAPQFLDTACTQSSLDTLPGYEMCLGACTEAECCWKGDATCLGDSACEGYHHCVSLLDQGATDAPGTEENSFPEAPQYLAAACSNGSLDTNAGFQMCQDACMKAECCWKVTSCSERPECTSYSQNCANLVARLDELSNNDPATATLPEAPHDLDQTCDPAKVLDTDGYNKCSTACQETECCWKAGNPNSCLSNDQCKPWSPCTVMNAARDPTTAASEYSLEQVFDACLNHDNNVGGSNHTSLCQVVCQAGTCCFDEEKDCPNTVDCKVFEPCAVIHNEKTTQVETACAGDLADCVGVCAAATCCFTNDIDKICDITAPDVICRQYKACEVLYQAEKNP